MTLREKSLRSSMDPTAGPDDGPWVRAARAGDLAAFDALMGRHWHRVASVARRLCDDPNEVDDVLQETFILAFERLRDFRGESSIATWFIRIAINVCSNRRRSWHGRIRLFSDPEAIPPPFARAAGTPDMGEALAQRSALEDALRGLPEKYRIPLLLHFVEDLSGAEIAAAMDLKESTVWTRIYEGLRRLRGKLTDE